MPETVIDAEFGPDKAGQRVGWVYVEQDRNSETAVRVEAVMATVGPDGARSSHLLVGDQVTTERRSHTGFEAAVSVGGVVLRDQIKRSVRELHYASSVFPEETVGYKQDANCIVGNQMGDRPDYKHDEKLWVEGNAKFLAVLKKQLVNNGVCAAYPGIYYMLNHTAGHPELMPRDAAEDVDLLMADPSQQGATQMERARANVVAELISFQREVDDKMLTELNRWESVSPEQLVVDFVNSRKRIAELEAETGASAEQLVGRNGVYLPVGQGRHGRSHPYMDATKTDPDESYGVERDALFAGSHTRAQSSVMQETFELEGRRDYAFRGFDVLCRLASLEDALK